MKYHNIIVYSNSTTSVPAYNLLSMYYKKAAGEQRAEASPVLFAAL